MQRPHRPVRPSPAGRPRGDAGKAWKVGSRSLLVVGLIGATLLVLPSSGGASAAPSHPVALTTAACAPGWTSPRAGRQTFVIANRTTRQGAIYLFNPFTGVTVGQRTGLPPKSSTTMRITLKPGHYAWSCHLSGQATHQSVEVTVRPIPVLTAAGPTTKIPVAPSQLTGPVQSYRTYVQSQLGLLVTQVAGLRAAIAGGQLGQAESSWLTAHLTWQRLGAAYDAFGTLGTRINGLAIGQDVGQTPGSGGEVSFEGFHKIERDLWGQADLGQAGLDSDQLATNLATLVARFSADSIPPAELLLRTHEILEDSQRDELSGADDYGSGTDMASVEADVTGTEVLLHLLAPLLKSRAPDLVSRAMVQLQRLDAALAATEQNGHWVAVSLVPEAQREKVDGAMGAALEILAIVPDITPVIGSTL
jgi:high-affinity iron transporter